MDRNIELVEPVFLKIHDLNGKNDVEKGSKIGYEMCRAVSNIVGVHEVDGVQQVRSLFRIYLKSKEARVRILLRANLPVL